MVAQSILILVRLLLALAAGYGVSAGLAAFAAVALTAVTTLPRSEAVVLASMLAFLVYLAILVWAFAERRFSHLCVMMAAAGAVSWGGALGLARLIG